MNRLDASAILDTINSLLTSEGNTQRVQSYVAQLEGAGYPLKATIKGNTVMRYRPEISIRKPVAKVTRPYYLIEVSMMMDGRLLQGYSCVRMLEDGTVSDWHKVGMMLKPKAQRRLTELNNAYERRLLQESERTR